MIKIPLNLHTSCPYGGNYRFNDQLKRGVLLEFLTHDKIISHFFGIRDEDWSNFDVEPYLYLKGFNGKFILKVNGSDRENQTRSRGNNPTVITAPPEDYREITIDLYYRPLGYSNATDEQYISYITIYPNDDNFERDMHTGYNLYPPAYLCVIPINAKCTAFIFTYNSMLLPVTCFIFNEKDNEKYLSIFGYERKQTRFRDNIEWSNYWEIWLEKNSDYGTTYTSDNIQQELFEYFYLFYDTKSNSMSYNKTDKQRQQLTDVLKPYFFAYDSLNSLQTRDYYPLVVGDCFIPDVYILNGGANTSLYLRETKIDDISYYSLFNNILIKNNDVDGLLLDNSSVQPVRDFLENPLEICIFKGEIEAGSSGIQIILNNFNNSISVPVKVYKNNNLYDQWPLPHINQEFSNFTVNNKAFGSYAGESSHIVRGNPGEIVKITTVITDIEAIKRISYSYSQTFLTEDNIKAPSALDTVILNTNLFGNSNRPFQLKRIGAGDIYYTTVFPFSLRSDLMGYSSGTCFLLLSQTSQDLDNIYWEQNVSDTLTKEWTPMNPPFRVGYNNKTCFYGKSNIFTISYENETWYGRLVWGTASFQRTGDGDCTIQRGAFFGLDETGYDSYDFYLYGLGQTPEGYKNSDFYKNSKFITGYQTYPTVGYTFSDVSWNRRKENLSCVRLMPAEDTSVFWQLPCYSGVTEIHYKIFEDNYDTGVIDPKNAFSPEAAYNLITMIHEWEKKT